MFLISYLSVFFFAQGALHEARGQLQEASGQCSNLYVCDRSNLLKLRQMWRYDLTRKLKVFFLE